MWSLDALFKPWESPYAAYANNPILFVDPLGLDGEASPLHPGYKTDPVTGTADVFTEATRSSGELILVDQNNYFEFLNHIGTFNGLDFWEMRVDGELIEYQAGRGGMPELAFGSNQLPSFIDNSAKWFKTLNTLDLVTDDPEIKDELLFGDRGKAIWALRLQSYLRFDTWFYFGMVVAHSLPRFVASARSLGLAGERALGVAGPKTAINIGGRTRFPDGLTRTTLIEVKNVQKLSFTSQLRDYSAFSQQTGRQFILFTRTTTSLSGPLQKAIEDGLIIHKFIPGY